MTIFIINIFYINYNLKKYNINIFLPKISNNKFPLMYLIAILYFPNSIIPFS